jgi:hypothetical protein
MVSLTKLQVKKELFYASLGGSSMVKGTPNEIESEKRCVLGPPVREQNGKWYT